MSTPTETVAGALLREQGARFDGFALDLDDLEPEDRAATLGEARAALVALDQHRDDIARVMHDTVCPDGARCEAGPDWSSFYRQADAVLAYLTGGAS